VLLFAPHHHHHHNEYVSVRITVVLAHEKLKHIVDLKYVSFFLFSSHTSTFSVSLEYEAATTEILLFLVCLRVKYFGCVKLCLFVFS